MIFHPFHGGVEHFARRRRGVHRVIATVSLAVVAIIISGCTTAPVSSSDSASTPPSSSADDSYGSLPTFLPSGADNPDQVLTGAAGRPAMTVEGDSVDVHMAGASVRATVSGPEVPGEGLPYQAEATTCTWTITFANATADVAVSADQFTTLDHLGGKYEVVVAPGQAAPSKVVPGRTVTFQLRAVMPTGEGIIRWAPDGQHIAASWDFEVEND